MLFVNIVRGIYCRDLPEVPGKVQRGTEISVQQIVEIVKFREKFIERYRF